MNDDREKKNEVESFDHSCHPHPLVLSEFEGKVEICWGCTRNFRNGEMVYRCGEGCSFILHEECAEMPPEIKLSMHRQHILIQREMWFLPSCAACERKIRRIGYYCAARRDENCRFQVHVGCAYNMIVSQSYINHPSHPQHQLTMLRRPARSRCDACGTVEKGNSYICTACQYWIHESCAGLSATALYRHHHHHHHLSLIYNLPIEYIKYNFRCEICFDALIPRYWAYHCEICRYVVHIKCALKTIPTTASINNDAVEDDKDVIVFPLKNGVEELIGSFVIKIGGVNPDQLHDQIVNGKYKFHNHDHQLRLVSSSSVHHQEEEDEEENSDEDDFNCGDESKLICDGCTMPIFPNKPKSLNRYGSNYYMSCGECNYFLHWACFHLPPQISCPPLHHRHILTLHTCPKFQTVVCSICRISTNGLFYECESCYFNLDIKCASLPNTIKHSSHSHGPRHNLKLLIMEDTRNFHYWQRSCIACGTDTYRDTCYECDACKTILHSSCALLPAFVANRAWDKHRLPLTFDASVNHPSSFCCDICEGDMNPKQWMYHCRTCDLSVHPKCFPTASGKYRNTKFGQQYDVATIHHHPVAYQLLTNKLHCDVCGRRKDYGCQGFQCVSTNCDFFMCLNPCAANRRADMHDRLIEEHPSSDQ